MSIILTWDNPEKTVLRYDFESNWTWQELRSAASEAKMMVENAAGEVSVIYNFSKYTAFPAGGVTALRGLVEALGLRKYRSVIVGAKHPNATLFAAITKLTCNLKEVYPIAGTLEEAHLLLRVATSTNIQQPERKMAIPRGDAY